MRVLVVTTWFPSIERPTEAPFILEHCKAIACGHDVRIVHMVLGSTRSATTETYAGLTVVRVGVSPRSPLSLLRSERLLHRELRDAELLHTMAFSSVLTATPAWLFRRRIWVHTEHWTGITDPGSVNRLWARVAFLRHALRLPHAVTAVSNFLATGVAPFSRPGAVRVVPNVVPAEGPVHPLPAEDGTLRLVAVGALILRKQPLVAVETVRLLRNRGFDVRMTWVGDGPMRSAVCNRVSEVDIEDAFNLAGSVPPAEVARYYDDAHIFFVPTTHETFFLGAAEAIARGRPVVLPQLGGYGDFITPQNSILVDPPTAEGFAAAISTVHGRISTLNPESIAAPVRRAYSSESVGVQLNGLYAALRQEHGR